MRNSLETTPIPNWIKSEFCCYCHFGPTICDTFDLIICAELLIYRSNCRFLVGGRRSGVLQLYGRSGIGILVHCTEKIQYYAILVVLYFYSQKMIQQRSTSSNSMHTMWNASILKPCFHHKMWGDSRFVLIDGYLLLWSFVSSSQKWIRLSIMPSYFSFKTPSFHINGCYRLLHPFQHH